MFPHCSIYTVCLRASTVELRARPPSSLPFSSLPSLNVGSSLRLHFSCLGSLLSSQLINHPPICTLNRSAPAPTVPAHGCQATPRTEEGLRDLQRASQGGRMGEREKEGGKALPNGHPLCRNNRPLSLSVFQRAGTFSLWFPPSEANRALL